MPDIETILQIAIEARTDFERGSISRSLLRGIYLAYNPDVEIEEFLTEAASMFPRLNCGLATAYVRHRLGGAGEIVNGAYSGANHTFLALGTLAIADITADQFGGPAVYVGSLTSPWSSA
jgi:hypothetical protein